MNHPLIAHPDKNGSNVQYVSISSQDRNLRKNPDSNDFVINLPQEYRNVESVKLASSYFPIVDDQFSEEQNNVDLCFDLRKHSIQLIYQVALLTMQIFLHTCLKIF